MSSRTVSSRAAVVSAFWVSVGAAGALGCTQRPVVSPGAEVEAQPEAQESEAQAAAAAPSTGPGAFVYRELQLAVPFTEAPWRSFAESYAGQAGLLSTTWLSGVGNQSLGSVHSFDSVEHARAFVTSTLPREARALGVAQTSRLFDARVVRAASQAMQSVYWGAHLERPPGAFVYTEVQVSVPFDRVPWKERNPLIRANAGFLAKTWFSGVKSQSVGGLYAFDSVEHAKRFAIDFFAASSAKQGVAFYTRVFDAQITEEANREFGSPFYAEASAAAGP